MMEVFDKGNYELEKLKITELTNTKKYYASVDVDVNKVKIYTVAPLAGAALAGAALAGAAPLSLFEIVDENTKYELGIGPTPDNAVPFYVIMEHLDGCDYYKVSDNLYILPSLTPEKIETKVNENKVANELLAKTEADRVEAERVAEQERLAKIEADRVEAERVAEQERLANIETARVEAERVKKIEDDRIKVETDRINICNLNLKHGNIFIQDKPIDYDCFTYFKNVKKITLINVTNIKDIFSHIQKLSSIEEIEIISNDRGKVFTFATDFDKTITEENISMLLSNLKNLEIIKFEYMIGIKTAETFLSVLMKLNKKSLKSVSICPSEEYFKNMRKTFKNTTQKNDRFVRDMTTDKIEEKLIKIQNAIDLLLQFN